MTESNPCVYCKYYENVGWKHKGMGCSLANTRFGSDGYGPFYTGPSCIYDQDAGALKSKFESAQETDYLNLKERLALKEDLIYKLQREIDQLNRSILKLSKEEL